MGDDSCVMKFIEVVPLINSTDSAELPDFKHPVQVKVCIATLLLLFSILEHRLASALLGVSVLSVFRSQMPFLLPNREHQSTE